MGRIEEQLLTTSQLAEHLGVQARTIMRWVAEGKLPEPLRMSRKILRWKLSEVTAAMNSPVPA